MKTNFSLTPSQERFIKAERTVLNCRSIFLKTKDSLHPEIEKAENYLNSHAPSGVLQELSKRGYITRAEGSPHWYVRLDNLVAPVPITKYMRPATNRPFAGMKYPAYSG